ncbi:MAG: prepilin-type N-terminal cleavage/methylation domain-containing protein [Gemmatimonadota bacterium]
MRPRSTRRPRAGGFTLLEVLVALAILGLGVTSVLQLLGASARNAARSQATTRALFTAEALMEQLAALDETQLRSRDRESGDLEEATRRGRWAGWARGSRRAAPLSDGSAYGYALRVTREPDQPSLYRVDLQLAWDGPATGRVDLTTLRRFPSAEIPDRNP